MIKSPNKPLGKNKYYNFQKGKKEHDFFFLFPSVLISPKKFLNWDTIMFSIFLGWGKYYIQYNVFEIIKNNSAEVQKTDMVALLNVLKSENLHLSNENDNAVSNVLDYLNKNKFLICLLKNSNLQHPYIKSVIVSYFKNQPFIIQK